MCGAKRGCSVGKDGLIFCRGKTGKQPGFTYHGQAEKDPQWGLYRPEVGDGSFYGRCDPPPDQKIKGRKGEPNFLPCPLPWLSMAKEFSEELTPERKAALASHLGLPVFCLDDLFMLGSHKDSRFGHVWTFPELNGEEQVCGINRRMSSGKQQVLARARRGLTIRHAWEEREGPLFVVEGATDVLALAAMDLTGIGRPSARGGIDELATLLAGVPTTRPISVIGEWDAKPDGTWPGRDGAKWTAEQLAGRLRRKIGWGLCPEQKKDIRAWVHANTNPENSRHLWQGIGQRFLSKLVFSEVDGSDSGTVGPQLSLRCYQTIDPKVMHWAIPGYFPEGELVLLAGDGGEGKSLITLHIAACMTRGRPCFGLTYTPHAPQNVLLACCEDDASVTTKPRLMAAGADMERIFAIEGVLDSHGKQQPFGLGHIEQIGNSIRKLGNVGLVVIDPVTAYLGTAGVDDGKDVEIRTLLEPLRVMIREAGSLALLVKHFNKSISAKASARIAGSAGWRNACRASYLVLPDPSMPLRKLFLPDKLTGAPLPTGHAYRPALPSQVEIDGILQSLPATWPDEDRLAFRSQLARVDWLGETDLDADSVCQEQTQVQVDAGLDVERAAHWLRKALGNGPMRGADVEEDGNTALEIVRAQKWWRDRVLKNRLGGTSQKAQVEDGPWYFCLPGQHAPGPVDEAPSVFEESEEVKES